MANLWIFSIFVLSFQVYQSYCFHAIRINPDRLLFTEKNWKLYSSNYIDSLSSYPSPQEEKISIAENEEIVATNPFKNEEENLSENSVSDLIENTEDQDEQLGSILEIIKSQGASMSELKSLMEQLSSKTVATSSYAESLGTQETSSMWLSPTTRRYMESLGSTETETEEEPQTPKPPAVGIDEELIPALRKAFSNLCTNRSGVLFENSLLQVGLKHEYKGANGKLSLLFSNLSPSSLHNFSVKLAETPYFETQTECNPNLLGIGVSIASKTQEKLHFSISALDAFAEAPDMTISFDTDEGITHEYPLKLPIVTTHFMEPVILKQKLFSRNWDMLADEESSELVTAPQKFVISHEYMKRIGLHITQGLHFGRCLDCDKTPWTLSAAANFKTAAKDENGRTIDIGCVLKVDANPKQGTFRVTTRSEHPLCSEGVKNVAGVQYYMNIF